MVDSGSGEGLYWENDKDCDMVCACMKVQDARSGAG